MTCEPRGAVHAFESSTTKTTQFGWLRGSRKFLKGKKFWLRGVDLNHRPLGYEGNSALHSTQQQTKKTRKH